LFFEVEETSLAKKSTPKTHKPVNSYDFGRAKVQNVRFLYENFDY